MAITTLQLWPGSAGQRGGQYETSASSLQPSVHCEACERDHAVPTFAATDREMKLPALTSWSQGRAEARRNRANKLPSARFYKLRRFGLALAAAVAIFALGATAAVLLVPASVTSSRTATKPATRPPPAASAEEKKVAVAPTATPNPQQLALTASDLPPGFAVVRAAPAVTSGSGQPAPSWDAVFERGTPSSPGFRAAESLVVIYSDLEEARAGFRQQADMETGRNGERLPISFGDESVAAVEQAPNLAGLHVVRLTFRRGNLLAQVSLLGQPLDQLQAEAFELWEVQEARLNAAA
jgi:hypothetical protein